ncbi:vegetative cell wall protein gp1-like [Panicum virgatum]|uniref:vegetative cell wall protein gp1-like n=1 Tax=Panicum virgatum TaxID=38727 RepID=UPI0019D4F485|nr:vegetative cell wall protein gp1-like [Panicum virgatum]
MAEAWGPAGVAGATGVGAQHGKWAPRDVDVNVMDALILLPARTRGSNAGDSSFLPFFPPSPPPLPHAPLPRRPPLPPAAPPAGTRRGSPSSTDAATREGRGSLRRPPLPRTPPLPAAVAARTHSRGPARRQPARPTPSRPCLRSPSQAPCPTPASPTSAGLRLSAAPPSPAADVGRAPRHQAQAHWRQPPNLDPSEKTKWREPNCCRCRKDEMGKVNNSYNRMHKESAAASWALEAWKSCPRKKLVAATAVTMFWNMFSVKTRVMTAHVQYSSSTLSANGSVLQQNFSP